MPRRDDWQCARCRVYWNPGTSPDPLRWRHDRLVCADRAACDSRLRWWNDFDRMIRVAQRKARGALPLVSETPTYRGDPAAALRPA